MNIALLFAVLAFVSAVLASGVLGFVYAYDSESCNASVCWTTSRSLAEVNGNRVYAVLAIPILLTGFALLAIYFPSPMKIRWLIWGSLVLFVFLGIASIGYTFLPSTLFLLLAVVKSGRRTAKSREHHSRI